MQVYGRVSEESAGCYRFPILEGAPGFLEWPKWLKTENMSLGLFVKWRPRVAGMHNVALERPLGEFHNERNQCCVFFFFFKWGAYYYKGPSGSQKSWAVFPEAIPWKLSPSSSAFSEAALTSLELNMLPETHLLWNKGPGEQAVSGKFMYTAPWLPYKTVPG